jgi:hypothetical protein
MHRLLCQGQHTCVLLSLLTGKSCAVQGAPRPPNEDFRLSVLRSYNLMDTVRPLALEHTMAAPCDGGCSNAGREAE